MAWTNDPSGIGLSAVPANGGTGWQAWTSYEASGAGGIYSAGPAYYNNALGIYPNLASGDTSCFRMYAPNVEMSVSRQLAMPLSEGNGIDTGVLTLKLGINFRHGEKGARFYTGGTLVAGFRAMTEFSTTKYMGYDYNGGWVDISYPYQPDSVFTLKIWKLTVPGIGDYNIFKVFRENYENQTPLFNKTILYSGTDYSGITEVVVYSENVDPDPLYVNENTICFNSLTGHSAYR
jgi:hypothetical protein